MSQPKYHSHQPVKSRAATLQILTLAIASICLAGCASSGPYRTYGKEDHSSERHSRAPNIEQSSSFTLGFVEFDPQGWLWDQGRTQMRDIQREIAKQANLSADKPTPVILIVFVHGWKHNAAGGDGNVQGFKRVLERLAHDEGVEAGQAKRAPRPVTGVYVGWPGLRQQLEPAKTLSFYSRKNVADRVGYGGGVTEVLSRLEKMHREINERAGFDTTTPNRSFFVTVGHSFGSQVTFDAVHSIMTERMVVARVEAEKNELRRNAAMNRSTAREISRARLPENNPIQPFGDLVVLINPAFEASRYQNLKSLSEALSYPATQFPVLAIFSSEGDWATHYGFPLGRFFSTLFHDYRTDGERENQIKSDHRTVPWMKPWRTHALLPLEKYTADPNHPPLRIEFGRKEIWSEETRVRDTQIAGSVLVANSRDERVWTPFYVASVDKTIIKDHVDLWDPERPQFVDFLSYFIALPLFTEVR